MPTKDADYGFYNWVSHARDLWVCYGIQQADTRSVIKTKVIRHFESEVLHRLKERITEDRQLHLFTSFKTIYKFEPYLDYIQDFTIRCSLTKLGSVLVTYKLKQDDLVKTRPQEMKDVVHTAKP